MGKQKENDDFGNRMKAYEAAAENRLDGVVCVRIDGHKFSTFTRGLSKPFDGCLTIAMIETTKFLVYKTHAKIGYTQSDEISLILGDDIKELPLGETVNLPFDGRVQKLASVLAAMATAKFMTEIPPELQRRYPHFDARVFGVPSRMEASNVILWRVMDAKKNAIQAVAQAHFSHKQLQNKDKRDMLQMLTEVGVDFERDYPANYRLGTFIRKRNVECLLTDEELKAIPEQHRPQGPVTRSEYVEIPMPQFNLVKNRVEVIFENAEPTT